MANTTHIAAGLPPKRDGTATTGDNVLHIAAGIIPEITSGSTPSWNHKIYGVTPSKVYGIEPSKVVGV